MNPIEFETLMNRRTLTPEQKLFSEMVLALNENTDCIRTLLNAVHTQREQISELQSTLYRLAPDLEIIEAMADTPEEEAELIGRYMNYNPNWTEDRTP